jgi:hypothetical protein
MGGNKVAPEADNSETKTATDINANSAFADQTARLRFHPTDDAYVMESKPYDNFNDRFIVVDQNKRFDGLLRFYVSGLENRHVNYVKLRLFVSNASRFGGNFYRCTDKWHEEVVTWDTVPSISGNKRSGEPIAVVQTVAVDNWCRRSSSPIPPYRNCVEI